MVRSFDFILLDTINTAALLLLSICFIEGYSIYIGKASTLQTNVGGQKNSNNNKKSLDETRVYTRYNTYIIRV